MNSKYDWDLLKEYWLRSNCSLKTAAELYDVPYQSLRRHAAQWKWMSDWCMLRYMRDSYPHDKEILQPFLDEKGRIEYLNATKPKIRLFRYGKSNATNDGENSEIVANMSSDSYI